MVTGYVSCSLCGVDDARFLFVKDNEKIVQCNQCNLVYINPRPAGNVLKEKYEDGYSLGYIAKKNSKRKRARKIVKGILRFKKEGKFLDIGCSAGFILEAARMVGFEPYGVELCPQGVKYAREELNLQVFAGYLEDASFPDNFFDVITMYNLLEHVPDPAKLLREICRILKENGLVEIWTPNVGHRRAKRMGVNWPNFIPEHLIYYSLETLKRMLEKAGLCLYKNQFTIKDGLKCYAKKCSK